MPATSRITQRGLAALLALLTLLTSCGDLPRPFAGNVGRMGRLLAQPPPARLAVTAPDAALLAQPARHQLAADVATSLAGLEVPAFSVDPHPGDWRLTVSAERQGSAVVPRFTVIDAVGKTRGSVAGTPVDAEAWQAAAPGTLQQVADAAATPVSGLLTSIEASRQMSDPNSLLNRPARVAVLPITGAPGDGDRSLQRLMREQLTQHGESAQDDPAGADFTVTGLVKVTPTTPGDSTVEITWTVADSRGKQAGVVAQVHDEKLDIISGYWGELATAVCTEAAGGVHEVIANQLLKRPVGPSPPAAAPALVASAAPQAVDHTLSKQSSAIVDAPPLVEDTGPRRRNSGHQRHEDRRLQQQPPARRSGGGKPGRTVDARLGAPVRGHGSVRGNPREHPGRRRVRGAEHQLSGE